MIPLGFEFHPSPGEQVVLALMLGVLGVAAALPASCVLAAVGARRARLAGGSPGATAFWYWLCGTALGWAVMIAAANLQLGWWSVPAGWVPGLIAAWLLRAPAPRPGSELRWTQSRRPVGE
jgi:hypothetical protein